MNRYQRAIRYTKPLTEIDEKIARLNEQMTTSGMYVIKEPDGGTPKGPDTPATPDTPAVPPTYVDVDAGGINGTNGDGFTWPDQGDGNPDNTLPAAPSNFYSTYNGETVPSLRYIDTYNGELIDYEGDPPIGAVAFRSGWLGWNYLGYLGGSGIRGVGTTNYPNGDKGRAIKGAYYNWPFPGKVVKQVTQWSGLDCLFGTCKPSSQYYPSGTSNSSSDGTPIANRALYTWTVWLPADADGNLLPNRVQTDPGTPMIPGDPMIPGTPAIPSKLIIRSIDALGDPDYFPGNPASFLMTLLNLGRRGYDYLTQEMSGGDSAPTSTPSPDETPDIPPGGAFVKTDTGYTILTADQLARYKAGGGEAAINSGRSYSDVMRQGNINQLRQQSISNSKEVSNAVEKLGTAGKTYLDYLTNNLPDTIGNNYLGQKYVNGVFKDAQVNHTGTVTVGDNIVGTGGRASYDPKTNRVNIPFNYDFKTNDQEFSDASKEGHVEGPVGQFRKAVLNALGPYSADAQISTPIAPVNSLAGVVFGNYIWLSKTLGGAEAKTGNVSMDADRLKKLNPKFHKQVMLDHDYDKAVGTKNESLLRRGKVLSEGWESPKHTNIEKNQAKRWFDQKDIAPEYPKEPPAPMVAGYNSKSLLAPKPISREPVIKVTKKDFARNHRLSDTEINDMMDTINKINKFLAAHPEKLIHAQIRYPKHDPRLAELNWKMDQIISASSEYIDKQFPENKEQTLRVKKILKRNIELSDPKTFEDPKQPMTYGKIYGSESKDKMVSVKYHKSSGKFSEKSASRFLRKESKVDNPIGMSLYTKARKHIDMGRVKEIREQNIKSEIDKVKSQRQEIAEEIDSLSNHHNWRRELIQEAMTTGNTLTYVTLPGSNTPITNISPHDASTWTDHAATSNTDNGLSFGTSEPTGGVTTHDWSQSVVSTTTYDLRDVDTLSLDVTVGVDDHSPLDALKVYIRTPGGEEEFGGGGDGGETGDPGGGPPPDPDVLIGSLSKSGTFNFTIPANARVEGTKVYLKVDSPGNISYEDRYRLRAVSKPFWGTTITGDLARKTLDIVNAGPNQSTNYKEGRGRYWWQQTFIDGYWQNPSFANPITGAPQTIPSGFDAPGYLAGVDDVHAYDAIISQFGDVKDFLARTYDITKISTMRLKDRHTFVGLDDPSLAGLNKRDGFDNATAPQRLKKLLDMLKASDDYLKKMLGAEFPGTGVEPPGGSDPFAPYSDNPYGIDYGLIASTDLTNLGITPVDNQSRLPADIGQRELIYSQIRRGELMGVMKKFGMEYLTGNKTRVTETDLSREDIAKIQRNVQQLLDKGDGIYSSRNGAFGEKPPIKQEITNDIPASLRKKYKLRTGDRVFQMSAYFDRNWGRGRDISQNDLQTLLGNFVAITDSEGNIRTVRDDFDFSYGLERADSGIPGSHITKTKPGTEPLHPLQGLLGGLTGGIFGGADEDPRAKIGRGLINTGAKFGKGNPFGVKIDFVHDSTRKEEYYSWRNTITDGFNYKGKPSPNGFPENPPPQTINGLHPDLVDGKKKANYYKKLDPVSAIAMTKTGNKHIDKQVKKAQKKPK